jgi:hypothetical protein
MNEKLKSELEEISKIPIIIGITGHRDLRQEDYNKLKTLISDLIEDYYRFKRACSLSINKLNSILTSLNKKKAVLLLQQYTGITIV